MPAAHMRDASLTNLGGVHRPKPIPSEPHGLVADVDPALGQQILDVAQCAEANTAGQPDNLL
jgi:hypothetical protein